MARTAESPICSFCGRSVAEVRRFVAGQSAVICDTCITVCEKILDGETGVETSRREFATMAGDPK
jgi:ATP-dependent Clp protease ATP-binding subunit ClpX